MYIDLDWKEWTDSLILRIYKVSVRRAALQFESHTNRINGMIFAFARVVQHSYYEKCTTRDILNLHVLYINAHVNHGGMMVRLSVSLPQNRTHRKTRWMMSGMLIWKLGHLILMWQQLAVKVQLKKSVSCRCHEICCLLAYPIGCGWRWRGCFRNSWMNVN